MPEFFRAYGEILRREHDGNLEVFAALVGAVLLLLAVLIVGALFQGIARWWKRVADARPRAGSRSRRPFA